jgi:hypothetical protein
MNAKKVLSKILTLLSTEEVNLTYAKLKDGTIVESATFDVGEDLFVVSEDGTKTLAPDGEHELALKDESGNENLIKVITKDGKIVERENVEVEMEAETVKVEEIPQASGDKEKANEVKDQKNQVESGTLEMAEETEEAETIPQDDEAPMKEEKTMELGDMAKKIEEMAYKIEEMEKKMEEMAKTKMEDVEDIKGEEEDEEEDMPKLDGAPVEEVAKFSSEKNKAYGKKVANTQSAFLSKLYK